MKKHVAVLLSVLALLISIASAVLSAYWRLRTVDDIDAVKLELINAQIELREEQLQSLEERGKIDHQIFCLLGDKEACEK